MMVTTIRPIEGEESWPSSHACVEGSRRERQNNRLMTGDMKETIVTSRQRVNY